MRRYNQCLWMLMIIFILAPVTLAAQGKQEKAAPAPTTYGVGFQGAFPASGLSGMINIDEKLRLQAILGFFGSLKTFAARGLYTFQNKSYWDAYAYGMLGFWSYTGLRFVDERGLVDDTETVIGFGGGAGIEWDWRVLSPELPPIFWNLELGIGFANFDHFDFSSFIFGAGVHYRF